VGVGDNGSVVMHCHHVDAGGQVGCTADAIVQLLGLSLKDLFPQPNGPIPKSKSSPKPKRSWATLDQAVEAVGRAVKATSRTVWLYLDRDGKPAMSVVRYDSPSGKTYRPLHVLPDGSWAVGDPPGPLPLYGLPWLDGADVIFATEGEKCADAVCDLGLIATTSAHGSGSAAKSDWSPMSGKTVVILPDCGVAGEAYLADVLRLLKALSPRPTVKVLRLPGLADGEDIVEWIAHTVGEGKPPLSTLQGLLDAARRPQRSPTTPRWQSRGRSPDPDSRVAKATRGRRIPRACG
jgi:hypothetical protein